MESAVLDSSAVIAFYDSKDPHHEEALRLSDGLVTATVVLHPYVVQEVATVLTYRFAPALTEQFFKDIRESANLLVPAVELYKDIDYFLRTGTKMSFTDVTLVRLAKEMHASLFTFDRQMLALFRRSA